MPNNTMTSDGTDHTAPDVSNTQKTADWTIPFLAVWQGLMFIVSLETVCRDTWAAHDQAFELRLTAAADNNIVKDFAMKLLQA